MDKKQYQDAVVSMKSVIPKGVKSKRIDIHSKSSSFSCEDKLAHCLYLLNNVMKFVEEGKKEKASRHLSFAQAILWSLDYFSIKQIGVANMKKGSNTYFV